MAAAQQKTEDNLEITPSLVLRTLCELQASAEIKPSLEMEYCTAVCIAYAQSQVKDVSYYVSKAGFDRMTVKGFTSPCPYQSEEREGAEAHDKALLQQHDNMMGTLMAADHNMFVDYLSDSHIPTAAFALARSIRHNQRIGDIGRQIIADTAAKGPAI